MRNFYRNPLSKLQSADKYIKLDKVQEEFDELYEEIFCELSEQYGKIQELHICENLIEHLAGNVYVKFRHEKDAEMCCLELNNRWFNGALIY
jgi:splicing factor U2AF subunit